MSFDYIAQQRLARSAGRETVRVGQRGDYWRVVYFRNGRCQQQRWFLGEAQARGAASDAAKTGRFEWGLDLAPLPADGDWHAMDEGSMADG